MSSSPPPAPDISPRNLLGKRAFLCYRAFIEFSSPFLLLTSLPFYRHFMCEHFRHSIKKPPPDLYIVLILLLLSCLPFFGLSPPGPCFSVFSQTSFPSSFCNASETSRSSYSTLQLGLPDSFRNVCYAVPALPFFSRVVSLPLK